jgi:hypothetical protein
MLGIEFRGGVTPPVAPALRGANEFKLKSLFLVVYLEFADKMFSNLNFISACLNVRLIGSTYPRFPLNLSCSRQLVFITMTNIPHFWQASDLILVYHVQAIRTMYKKAFF